MASIAFHPLANLFPLLEGAAFDELVEDVRTHGLLEKIVIHEGMILDGRNRYRAALAAGIVDPDAAPEYGVWAAPFGFQVTGWAEGISPRDWVISKNLHRRHLSESQRAMVAGRLADLGVGRPALWREGNPANLPDLSPVKQADAAEMLHVSERSVRAGRQVLEHGAPELIESVDRGDVSVSAAAELARLPVDEQAEILAQADPRAVAKVAKGLREAKQAEKKARRETREAELGARQRALPDRRYGVILADPEWRFETWSRDTGMDRAADNHYPTSTLDAIKGRPVADIAAQDCALLLWVPAPLLPQGLEILEAWGFAYRSHVIWLKDKVGTGYWFRNQHEILLLGTRGSVPAPSMGDQYRSALAYDVGAHSEKPPFAHEIAEAYWPSLPRIELNARARREGWDAWGLEAPEEETSGPALPPAPGPMAPVEFTVGGMRKQHASTSIRIDADGTFSWSYDIRFQNAGARGPHRGAHATFSEALAAALTFLRGWLGDRAGSTMSTTTTETERAAARGGIAWIDKQAVAWGLDLSGAEAVDGPDAASSRPAERPPGLVHHDEPIARWHAMINGYEPPAPFAWTSVAESILRAGYAARLPAVEIGLVLGCARGAVVGKANRLGLTDRGRQGARTDLAAREPAQ